MVQQYHRAGDRCHWALVGFADLTEERVSTASLERAGGERLRQEARLTLKGLAAVVGTTDLRRLTRRPSDCVKGTIVGGLIFSQALTLYTTPMVYVYFDRLREYWENRHRQTFASPHAALGVPTPFDNGVARASGAHST
jgi:hypothetical protein